MIAININYCTEGSALSVTLEIHAVSDNLYSLFVIIVNLHGIYIPASYSKISTDRQTDKLSTAPSVHTGEGN